MATTTTRRKIVTRYDGTKGTVHRAIAGGTLLAATQIRWDHYWLIHTYAPGKPWLIGKALAVPMNELKYRGKYVGMLPEAIWLSEDR